MFVTHRFHLNQYTKDIINDMEPKFGYGAFGETSFYRTYSRYDWDTEKQEHWPDVVIRVIEGTFSIRKDWYLKNFIPWNEEYWQNIAKDMAVTLFNLEWCPGGRGLFIMGTKFIYERGGMALANCGYTDIDDDFENDLAWLMDSLMLGVGIGFHRFEMIVWHLRIQKVHILM
jgi:ribonucleoside-triphosphate reductase